MTVLRPSFLTVISNLRDFPTSIFSLNIFLVTLISYKVGIHNKFSLPPVDTVPAFAPVPGPGNGED